MDIQSKKLILAIFLSAYAFSHSLAQCRDSNDGGTNGATSSTSFGQSFTPTCDGQLNSIAVIGYVNTSGHTVTIYEGDGTSGTVLGSLSSQSVSTASSPTDFSATVFNFSSEGISLTNGSAYTFIVSGAVALRFVNSDVYGGGQLYFNGSTISTADLNFEANLSAPLPVVWTASPQVSKVGLQARISFAVAQQINNSHFEVEHSLDGDHYHFIGQIEGEGNTSTEKAYTFDHQAPKEGHNYYRIKQVDFDGNYSYSQVTSMLLQTDQLTLYPNPVADNLRIRSPKADQVVIYNLLGHQLKLQSLEKGSNLIDLSDLQSGTYLVRFGNGRVERILKR